jgi:hypothetical protein
MNKKPRRRFNSEFKAKVALYSLRDSSDVHEKLIEKLYRSIGGIESSE